MSEKERTQTADSLSTDAIFDLLRHPRRRMIVDILTTHERKLTVNDLTKEIVAQRYGAPITDVPSGDLTRVAVSLFHNRIPRLTDRDVIAYDGNRRIVEPTEKLEQLEPYLSSARR